MPYNFVIFSLSPWNINYGANIKDLSYELAKHHRVLYIDTPLKRKDRWLKRDKPFVKEVEERIKSGNLLKQVSENLWHYIRSHYLSNRTYDDYDALLAAGTEAYRKLTPEAIRSVCRCQYIEGRAN